MVKQNQIISLLFFFLLLGSNFVFGNAKNAGSNKPMALLPQGSLQDSLVGVWVVTNVDVSGIDAQIAAATSQIEKDNLAGKKLKMPSSFMGLKLTIAGDNTYESILGQIYLRGTWTLSNRDLTTHSVNRETKDRVLSIVSVSNTTMVVKYNYGGSIIVVTYTKR